MAVALYVRVSTVRQAKADLSIPDQLNQLRAWCRQHGFTVAKEYVEPGASATDDRRPVFQQMMEDATRKPFPFEAIIVHSRSRFFRDMYGTLHYEQIAAGGCRTGFHHPAGDQRRERPVAEEPDFDDGRLQLAGECQAYEPDDEGERATGVLQRLPGALRLSGDATDVPGHKGKVRKQLAVDDLEAPVVRRIFDLYRHGLDGKPMGMKAIATHLNAAGTLMRGRPWRIQKLHDLLGDPTYRGEYRYNMRDSRTGLLRPESEWIRYAVESIIQRGDLRGGSPYPRGAGPEWRGTGQDQDIDLADPADRAAEL